VSLTPNAPIDRLKYIVKTYGEKQPWVVLDTLSVIFNTIGIDNPEYDLEDTLAAQGSPVWGEMFTRMTSRLRSMFGNGGQLHAGLIMPSTQPPLADVSYREQLGYWWFGDPEVEKRVQVMQRPASTLRERLELVLELIGAESFPRFNSAIREPSDADGTFPWVARELSKLSKHTISEIDGGGPLAQRAEYDFYVQALYRLRRSCNLIAQWAKSTGTDIMKMSLADVFDASANFREKKKVHHGEVVYKFKSGWAVEELREKRQLECEKGFLSHCVPSYKSAIDRGESVIYSLRDPDGVPYVTMEWKPARKAFAQIFGKTNSNIGDPAFVDYVFTEGQKNDPPLREQAEVMEVVELIRTMVVEFIDKAKGGDVRGLLLAGASLKGRSLSGVNLANVNLTGKDLAGADLTGANMANANLTDANLADADLRYAVMRNTYLNNAVLRNADLSNVDLSSTDMTGVDLIGAKYNAETIWPDELDPHELWHRGAVKA